MDRFKCVNKNIASGHTHTCSFNNMFYTCYMCDACLSGGQPKSPGPDIVSMETVHLKKIGGWWDWWEMRDELSKMVGTGRLAPQTGGKWEFNISATRPQ